MRPHCIEDDYEYRVKKIFERLRKIHSEEESGQPFLVWLEKSHREVAHAFLDDVTDYMGLPLIEGEG